MRSSWKTASRTVVISANSSWNLANFRAAIIAGLLKREYRVCAVVPDDESASSLRAMGVEVHHVPVDARGLSLVRDAHLLLSYRRLLRRLRPSAFLGFTAKPNIYGSIAAAQHGIPVLNTITGLGTGFLSGRMLQSIVSILYRWGLRHSYRVFFHNPDDRDLFIAQKIVTATQAALVPGSGVDLQYFSPAPERDAARPPTFLFIGRFLKDKGAMEFAQAAVLLRKRRTARFQMLGSIEDHPKAVPREAFQNLVREGTIELLGTTEDVRPYIAEADCIVLPSYREGLPRVLLEASAIARPAIATDVPGCRHAIEDGVTGLLCEARSAASLAKAMTTMAQMSPRERAAMGWRARQRAEREFSQERVVEAYLDALQQLGV